MHFPIFSVFANPTSVCCLTSLSLGINASFNLNKMAVLFMKFLNDERHTLRSVTSQPQSFSEPNWIGFKGRMIAASLFYSQSVLFLLKTSDQSIVQA